MYIATHRIPPHAPGAPEGGATKGGGRAREFRNSQGAPKPVFGALWEFWNGVRALGKITTSELWDFGIRHKRKKKVKKGGLFCILCCWMLND
jgi:hypothetical protein